MSFENDLVIPVQVKYVEAQRATILRNEKIPQVRKASQEPLQKATVMQNGLCQSPVQADDVDISRGSLIMSPSSAGSPTNPLIPNKFQFDPNLTYAEKVAHEMLVTEKVYLDNLKQIIDGFLGPCVKDADLDISRENIDDLFINVEEIYQFNSVLFQDMEKCHFDPVKLAKCFVVNQIGFDVYTKYCTHYPRSMEVLLEWNQREDTANFIKRQQESLGHTLPLCSFLLKPVQRILKYHLLLGNIAKHFKQSEDEHGYEIIQKALSAMTNVAKHINDMKRKHEDDIHLQEIESVLVDYEGPNLSSYGSIVLEDTFRLHGTKTGRYLFLFEKALLITKRRSDGTFSWKATVIYSNMMLADSIFREPLTFQVIPFDDRKICYTFVSRDLETKQVWLLELKRRLLDSYAAAVPMKAKQIILGNGREDCEKENAEPDNGQRSKSSNNGRGVNQQRVQSGKGNSGQSTKVAKNCDSDRRKFKDEHESLEEKTRTSIDAIKSPLRRKLLVFKKRKFSSKDLIKSSKRVSWSSDDNNEESHGGRERLATKKYNENQERKAGDAEPYDPSVEITKKQDENTRFLDNNDNEVSISSLIRDGKTMVSVTGEEDNHSSGHVKIRGTEDDDVLPLKKRRLAKEDRQKCKSMPAGEFPLISEDDAAILTRRHSMSRLYDKFLEGESLDMPTAIRELQKYGLVNFKEHASRTKRLESYDKQLVSTKGTVYRRSDVTDDVVDDVIAKKDHSVRQTMKRVSAAFSDISPSFSPQKSPSSSTEDLINDVDDLTAGEENTVGNLTPEENTPDNLSPDDYTTGDLTPGDFPSGNLSLVIGSSVPDEVFTGQMPPERSKTVESKSDEEGKNLDLKHEYRENGDWNQNCNQNVTADNKYNEDGYDVQSQEDTHSAFLSEPSSYADTWSDSFDEHEDELLNFNEVFGDSYQRVFTLKRSYSEENLVSKFPFEKETRGHVSSKSYTHFDDEGNMCQPTFDHAPIMRSKSADCSRRTLSKAQPFTFSVTPKKKIVIKDSLWETIREDGEMNNDEIKVAKDVQTVRRRRKRKSGQKRSRKSKAQQSDIHHLVRTYASLTMGDYRHGKNDDTTKSTSRSEKNGSANHSSSNDYSSRENDQNAKHSSSNDFARGEDDENSKLGFNESNKVEPSIRKADETVASNESKKTEDKQAENKKASFLPKITEDNNKSAPVTKIAVALRKKSPRQKSLVNVDNNESEVPSMNYVCVEAHPTEEPLSTNERPEIRTRDLVTTSGNTASKVGRLSKYFNNVTTGDTRYDSVRKHSNEDEAHGKGYNIKNKVEKLARRELDLQKTKYSEDIQEKIDVLQRPNSDENQTRTPIELTSSLNHDRPKVRQIRNKLESTTESESDETVKLANKHSKKATSLRVKDRIEELQHSPSAVDSGCSHKKTDKNVDDDLRTCKRLKERIAKLQKGAKREVVDHERDITISDDVTNESLTSPRQNEELRTVVIKRGWVQQFVQRIETGS